MKGQVAFFSLVGGFCLILVGIAFFLSGQNSEDDTVTISYRKEAVDNEESQRFNSVESESEYLLTYHWEDFEHTELQSSFSILKSVLKDAEEEFGYYPSELDQYVFDSLAPLRQEMIVHLKTITQNFIQKSRYSDYFFIEDDDRESFNLKISAPPSSYDAVKAEFERITRIIHREQSNYNKKMEKAIPEYRREFLYERGLRCLGLKIGINYSLVAKNNRPRLESVFDSLFRVAQGKNLHQFVSLLLSFMQKIRYGIPPVTENGKNILGFWVPPKVLVTNFGDCDCKGVTFASLWLSFKKFPLLLIKIPNHMFVGLAIPAFSEEGVVINGLRYTLCEVTGPDKIPLGIISPYSRMYFEGGSYSYELIN
jgi:hypothetical protein